MSQLDRHDLHSKIADIRKSIGLLSTEYTEVIDLANDVEDLVEIVETTEERLAKLESEVCQLKCKLISNHVLSSNALGGLDT